MDVKVYGYDFKEFDPRKDEKSIIDSVTSSNNYKSPEAILDLAKYSQNPVQIVTVAARARFTVPASMIGETTSVRYAGQLPLVAVGRDAFGNASMSLEKNSAVQVTFYSPEHPLGRTKVFTTLTR